MQSEIINEIATALAKAQSQIKHATKDSNNPFFKSQYADLTNVWEACRPALTSNGLSIVQYTKEKDERTYLVTQLNHISGQWFRGELPLVLQKKDMQGIGSAITYARRYGLQSMVGICPEDDDGNAACFNNQNQQRNQQRPQNNYQPQRRN